MPSPYIRPVDGGVELLLFIQPRASRNRFVGEHGDCLKVQLTAPPVEGEANQALLAWTAKAFGIPKHAVSLVSGQTSRRKRLRLTGVDVAAVEAVMKKAP